MYVLIHLDVKNVRVRFSMNLFNRIKLYNIRIDSMFNLKIKLNLKCIRHIFGIGAQKNIM